MFRFTIRDALWLMVVIGLSVGWWIDRSRLYEVASTPQEIWRVRAETMARVLRDDGWEVAWDRNDMHFKRGKVDAGTERPSEIHSSVIGAGSLPEDSN